MAAADGDDSLYPIAVLIDELRNEDVQVPRGGSRPARPAPVLPAAPIRRSARRNVTAALRVPVGGGASWRGARFVPTAVGMRGERGFARSAHSFCKRGVDWSAASPQCGLKAPRFSSAPPCGGEERRWAPGSDQSESGEQPRRGAAGRPMGGLRLPQCCCAAMKRRC